MNNNKLDFYNQEQLIEAIRWDCDYHCTSGREHHPDNGMIDEDLHARLKRFSAKHGTLFPKGLRTRVYTLFNVRGTIENHQIFDDATKVFKQRLASCKPTSRNRTRFTKPQQLVEFN